MSVDFSFGFFSLLNNNSERQTTNELYVKRNDLHIEICNSVSLILLLLSSLWSLCKNSNNNFNTHDTYVVNILSVSIWDCFVQYHFTLWCLQNENKNTRPTLRIRQNDIVDTQTKTFYTYKREENMCKSVRDAYVYCVWWI